MYLYGDLSSGFYYELRRNNDFKAEGAIQRGNSSVFKYKEQTYGCSLVGFVDDHITFGHPATTRNLTTKLTGRIEYPPDAFQEVGLRTLGGITQALAHVVGLDTP